MISEFRKDPVSGEWVLIAAGRAARPHPPAEKGNITQSKDLCPFEDLEKNGNEKPFFTFPSGSEDNWRIAIINNKYPAVTPGACPPIVFRNGYQTASGEGHHEIVILKDHDRMLTDLSDEEMSNLARVYRDRYRQIALEDACSQYISIFHNHGKEGGASLAHPHSQIISVPIIPPDVMRSLEGSERYYSKYGKEAHTIMIMQEMESRRRIVYDNDRFVAFCPFVSKQPYEIRIYPKFASGHFEETTDDDMKHFGKALRSVLLKVRDSLGSPAYNFFIHTSPLRSEDNPISFNKCYRWHVEVIPRVKFDAGFEAATGIKINIIDPDVAASTINGLNHG